jgi:hypothetical protein
MILVNIIDGQPIHKIDGRRGAIPTWNIFYTNDWWNHLFGFFEFVLFNHGSLFIICSVKFPRLHQQIVRFTHCTEEHGLQFCLHELVKNYTILKYLLWFGLASYIYVTNFCKILVFKKPQTLLIFLIRHHTSTFH